MCNCNKGKRAAQPRRVSGSGGTQAFSLLVPGQAAQQFGSRLEADAENARLGYRGIVKPVSG